MNHKYLRLMTLVALLLALLLAACGGGEEEPAAPETTTTETTAEEEEMEESEPTDEPEPTEEPEPTDEPEPTEEPAPEVMMGEEVNVEEGGFSVQAPADFTVDVFGDTVTIVAPDADPDLGPQFFLSGGPLDDGETVESILADFQESVLTSMSSDSEEPVEITVGDLAGYSIDFSAVENDQDLKGRIVILGNDTRGFVIFGGAEAGRWDEETAEQFDAMLASATFFEPVAAEEEEVVEENKVKSEEEGGAVGIAVGSGDPGLACVGSLVDGVTCLTADGTWLPLTTDNSNLGGDIVDGMTACGNSIYMAHNNGITVFDGESFTNFEGGWGFSSPSGVACDADGGLWVPHFQGVSYYDGAEWTTYESSLLSSGDSFSDLVEDVVVAADGTVWVSSANAVASFDGAEWTIYQEGQGMDDQYFFSTLVLDGSGQPWAIYSSGVLQWTGSEWVEHESDFFSLEGGAVDGEGNLWIGSFSDGAVVYDGSNWTSVTIDDGISNNTVRDIAVDGSGRVWLATRWGLSVWTGVDWQVYRMDTADMIDHDIYTVAVVGAGPALPEELSKAPGSLTGLITIDDEPFVDTTVEICIQTLGFSYYGDTPCSDQQLFYSTTTDESGTFLFEDVPVGLYVITVDTGDGWAQLETDYGTGERVFIGEGETTDVGELYIVTEE